MPLVVRAEQKETTVQLITMGPGETFYERFGHGALCVRRPNQPSSDWCFKDGNAQFETHNQLAWEVLRNVIDEATGGRFSKGSGGSAHR